MQPLGPNQIHTVDEELIDKTIEQINLKLGTPGYVKDWVCGGTQNPHYRFVVPGTVNDKEKEEIITRFKEVGWGSVEVTTSEEKGERPGLVMVILYVAAQSSV